MRQALEAEATQFDTYEDYLDHQIQPLDLYYLCVQIHLARTCCSNLLCAHCREDEDMARQLVELGFRGTSAETMKREEFEGKKQQASNATSFSMRCRNRLASTPLDRDCNTVMRRIVARAGEISVSCQSDNCEIYATEIRMRH